MGNDYTVGRYLVYRLEQIGLGHLFSIAGDYSIDWLNNYVTPSAIQLVQEVNELCAGYAADAYARMRGIGALCTTYSAGSFCAVNPIAGAYAEKVPVVLINGTPSVKRTLTFEQTGFSAHHFISGRQTNLQVFQYITTAAVRLDNADMAPRLIDYALVQCITERRPIYIELLQDVVEMPCQAPAGLLCPAARPCDAGDLAAAAKLIRGKLAAAQSPVIWLGPEIDRFGLQAAAADLIRAANVPFVTELMSKAVLSEDDPLFAGVFDGQASSPAVQKLVRGADFILALGVWLTDINDLGWNLDLDRIAFGAFDAVKYASQFWGPVYLPALIGKLREDPVQRNGDARFEPPFAELVPAKVPDDPICYQGFYDVLPRWVDENILITCDASLNYFGCILLKVPAQGGCIVQASYSAIGYAGPAATGMSLAKEPDQRVVVLTGDGGFQMTAQCLSTQRRFGLNPIIFVIDNGVYGVEQWLANSNVFGDKKNFYESCVLHRWDYSKLADVFDCKGWKVSTYSELEAAVTAALAVTDQPSIIQVIVPDHSLPDNATWKEAIDRQTG
jgi:indolepyruvate decarboxylase